MSISLNIVFAGTPDFAVPALEALIVSRHRVCAVYTQPDRPAGRGRKVQPGPVKQVALRNEIPVLQPLSLRSEAEQQQLARLAPDVMVVVAYGLILPPAVLAIPRLGCVNIHASLLPRWRGAAPIQRAILAGDRETGITIMQMEAGLDTGPALAVARCAIEATDNAQSLHDRLARLGADILLPALEALAAGTAEPQAQDAALATYAAKIDKAEAELDWHAPAADLDRKVRAFNPWPVAQTRFDSRVLRIWAATVTEGRDNAAPGTVLRAERAGIDVACAEGALRLLRVQLPGGRAVDAADFVNANDLRGRVLGGAE